MEKARTTAIAPVLILAIDVAFCRIAAQRFKDRQGRYPRIRAAMETKAALLERPSRGKGYSYPPAELFITADVFIRILKRERVLELRVRRADSERFALLPFARRDVWARACTGIFPRLPSGRRSPFGGPLANSFTSNVKINRMNSCK
ncbi:MAG: hypothetical protein D6723_03825 [Acidobacteria bacterium]|nr:MAG: hypothetical protein D6723_03825 [Acidobacteriota bacterium]